MSIERISSNSTVNNNIDLVRYQTKPIEVIDLEAVKEISKKETDDKQKISKESVQDIIDSMNDFLQPTQTSLKFQLHEKLQEYYVSIVDNKTQEVVREIPSKKLLDVYAAMTEFVGLMVDKKI
ncbi:flagellar protein FlaG [Bacillus luteolus]|uniref:Flagellar protein FlaG n=1 Tax=Litchfieldia luteola TaxID=682179 RepID=A0ABR9QFM7_9BACI|nr:flagellar protein FlaG [Cytobacillus luteolus]MBE4907049.1 flagellar protein FlaG [Cytobacillus luteolus]MBP1943484.1 flagellar protein FlaG [Cytobacillus luteolus]